jgi:ribose transport system permease protein
MLFSVAALLPVVLGMQFLLILGRFDLSAGATAALVGMVTGVVASHSGLIVALPAGLAVGALSGLATGTAIARFGIDPLVATLAMTGIERSLALVVNQGGIVTGLPQELEWLATARWLGAPALVYMGLLFLCAAAAAARHFVTFRRFYAVGSNEPAARRAGVNTRTLVVLGYVFVSLGAAASGIVQVSRTLSASPLTFQSLPIEAITACILGGASLSGGRGGVIGAAFGLMAVVATNNLVIMFNVSNDWKDFAVGILLLIVVLWGPSVSAIRNKLQRNLKETIL